MDKIPDGKTYCPEGDLLWSVKKAGSEIKPALNEQLSQRSGVAYLALVALGARLYAAVTSAVCILANIIEWLAARGCHQLVAYGPKIKGYSP